MAYLTFHFSRHNARSSLSPDGGEPHAECLPCNFANGRGFPPRLHLDIDDAALQSDGYGMGTVIGTKL